MHEFDTTSLNWRRINAIEARRASSTREFSANSNSIFIDDQEFKETHLPCRMGHCSAVIGHHLVVYGGETDHRRSWAGLIVFDLISHIWTRVECPDAPPQRLSCNLVKVDDTHCLLSGGKLHQYHNDFWLMTLHVKTLQVSWRKISISSPGYDISKSKCCIVSMRLLSLIYSIYLIVSNAIFPVHYDISFILQLGNMAVYFTKMNILENKKNVFPKNYNSRKFVIKKEFQNR